MGMKHSVVKHKTKSTFTFLCLAAKFWKQFELEPQIESRLVSKDNISQSSRPTETQQRVRSQPAINVSNEESSSRANTNPNIKQSSKSNNRVAPPTPSNRRPETRTISVSDMVKQLKRTSKFVNNSRVPQATEFELDDEHDMHNTEAAIENEMRQLELFDETLANAPASQATC